MQIIKKSSFIVFVLFNTLLGQSFDDNERLKKYIHVLNESGKEPVQFLIDAFHDHDLIIFDDALHTAVEPFEFYQSLVKTPAFFNQVKNIFLEAVSISKQPHLDAYFNSEPENIELLYPAFQDDINGLGWAYKTYFDLLHTIYLINITLPKDQWIKVFGVSNPTYWSEIKTVKDLELYQQTLQTHDFTMYKNILLGMSHFKEGKKGVFLTNTRHAYKGIKNKQDEFYWNCGTFFHQWHRGKTYSIHFHNVYLFLVKKETIKFLWDRIDMGIWDSAFAKFGNVPVALSLKDNVFGMTSYIGNHMLNAASNQTMYDAYDGLIFLGPLEKMHKTEIVDFIYTKEFKIELERRYQILFSQDQIEKEISEHGVHSLKELIDKSFVTEPQKLLPQTKSISPIDTWKKK